MKIYCYLLVSPCSPNIPVGTAFSNASQPHRRNETVHIVDRSGSDRDPAACCNPLRWQQHPGVSMGTTPARHLLPPLSLKYRTWLLPVQFASFITLAIHKYVRFCRQTGSSKRRRVRQQSWVILALSRI